MVPPHFKSNTLLDRIHWLMAKLWNGSQTKMAADLDVAQSTIANVFAGRRNPGRALLATLAAHPLVNEEWLRKGIGPPLLPEATTPTGEVALPIALALFSGMPDEHPDCLAELLHPVFRRLYQRSRYWIHLDDPNHPFVKMPELSMRIGDWVMMESDPENWPDDLRGKLCLVEVKMPKVSLLLLCKKHHAPDGVGTTWDFDFLEQHHTEMEDEKALYHEGRLKKDYDLGDESKSKPQILKKLPASVQAVAIYRCGEI